MELIYHVSCCVNPFSSKTKTVEHVIFKIHYVHVLNIFTMLKSHYHICTNTWAAVFLKKRKTIAS